MISLDLHQFSFIIMRLRATFELHQEVLKRKGTRRKKIRMGIFGRLRRRVFERSDGPANVSGDYEHFG